MKIYHNPRCSKSRQTLQILNDHGVEPEIVEYLKVPHTQKEVTELLKMLDIPALDLIRKGEKIYKENYKGKDLSEKEWIKAMVDNPILIERPIVIQGTKAVLGRPPEKVLDLL